MSSFGEWAAIGLSLSFANRHHKSASDVHAFRDEYTRRRAAPLSIDAYFSANASNSAQFPLRWWFFSFISIRVLFAQRRIAIIAAVTKHLVGISIDDNIIAFDSTLRSEMWESLFSENVRQVPSCIAVLMMMMEIAVAMLFISTTQNASTLIHFSCSTLQKHCTRNNYVQSFIQSSHLIRCWFVVKLKNIKINRKRFKGARASIWRRETTKNEKEKIALQMQNISWWAPAGGGGVGNQKIYRQICSARWMGMRSFYLVQRQQ